MTSTYPKDKRAKYYPDMTNRQFQTKRALQAAEIDVLMKLMFPALKHAARAEGFNLMVHGSLARDWDMVAVPWTDTASRPDFLVNALCKTIQKINKWGIVTVDDIQGDAKPHGRRCWTIVAGFGTHVDLSVFTPTPFLPWAEIRHQEQLAADETKGD